MIPVQIIVIVVVIVICVVVLICRCFLPCCYPEELGLRHLHVPIPTWISNPKLETISTQNGAKDSVTSTLRSGTAGPYLDRWNRALVLRLLNFLSREFKTEP